jgi:hypothetical protein
LRPLPPVASVVPKLPPPRVTAHQELHSKGALQAPVVAPKLDVPAEARSANVEERRRAVIRPLAPETYKIQFTMSREAHQRLREAQNLMRHIVPDGDPAAIFDRALTLLLKDLHKAQHAATECPRRSGDTGGSSRYVPAKIKREVWIRDGGQCAFIGANGRYERAFLEYHHVVPYAAGGRTSAANLSLRCRAHNRHEADLFFGPMMVRETPADFTVTRSGPS